MAEFTAVAFLVSIYAYTASSLYAGIILFACLFLILSTLFFRARAFYLPLPSLALFALLLVNVARFLSEPGFTQDLTFYLKCAQGYLYLALITVISGCLRICPLSDKPSRFVLKFTMYYFPFVYLCFYVFSFVLSGGNRASWLFEHNFELVYLNVLLSIAMIYRYSRYSPFIDLFPRRYLWLQGLAFSLLSQSLSGFLGFASIFLANRYKNLGFMRDNLGARFLISFKSKKFYWFVFSSALVIYFAYILIYFLRGGAAGADRFSYLSVLLRTNWKSVLFGNGIGSILPSDISSILLRQSNLVTLLDNNRDATSVVFHGALFRVLFDTGFLGLVVILWNFINIFKCMPSYASLSFILIFIFSGLSVGSFFNPLGAFSLLVAVCYVVGYSHLLFSVKQSFKGV